MNALQAKGNWNIVRGKLKQKFAELTENEMQFIKGKQEELIGRIQKRTAQDDQQTHHQSHNSCPRCKY